mmetsp:Transcript_124845/g.324298  ORF Transcript_124845/g.324298 Transcript_124845/m.324298 type:complete len:2327 (-) Transcript_124845:162-7142(-)
MLSTLIPKMRVLDAGNLDQPDPQRQKRGHLQVVRHRHKTFGCQGYGWQEKPCHQRCGAVSSTTSLMNKRFAMSHGFMLWLWMVSLGTGKAIWSIEGSQSRQHMSGINANYTLEASRHPHQYSCQGSLGFPIMGVRYIPHLVGEPYPHPESDPMDYYGKAYSQLHRRDLPLIAGQLGADTISLRPWPSTRTYHQNHDFYGDMLQAGVCKMIPSFQLAKYYAQMLREGVDKPSTASKSSLAMDFVRFAASVNEESLRGVNVVAWTVDLSLDLEELLPLVDKIVVGRTDRTCERSRVLQNTHFKMYTSLIDTIRSWVHPEEATTSAAPALQSVPFLLPLDLSHLTWLQPGAGARLEEFLQCMGKSYSQGGWSMAFSHKAWGDTRTRWLLSFAVPLGQGSTDFFRQLVMMSRWLKEQRAEHSDGNSAVIMVGTQALEHGDGNAISTFGYREDISANNLRYAHPFDDYMKVRASFGNLDGFIYDEWMDDWDRGSRGPFFLTAKSIHEMVAECPSGSRFSHDTETCARVVGTQGHLFPEYFGLATSSSQILRHCVRPRFSRSFFRSDQAGEGESLKTGTQCSFMLPSWSWLIVAWACLSSVAYVEGLRMVYRWLCASKDMKSSQQSSQQGSMASAEPKPAVSEPRVGYALVCPHTRRLRGEHAVELRSTRFKSDAEAGWWLWKHLSVQSEVLERQILAELDSTRAIRARNGIHPRSHPSILRLLSGGSTHTPRWQEDAQSPYGGGELGAADSAGGVGGGEDDADLVAATRVVHHRVLEGFTAWCQYVAAARGTGCLGPCRRRRGPKPNDLKAFARWAEENTGRPPARLFAEALLLRVMESLGEQVAQCPERLALLLFGILQESGCVENMGKARFTIDLDKLQDGLPQMSHHSNPYVQCKMPSGKSERGLNFDDINESGIQCRDGVAKTYREPAGVMVVLDGLLRFRTPLMIKMYCLGLAGYIYLGSHCGDDITTTHNGTLWSPKWLRINYIQYTALIDAVVWIVTESLLLVYAVWQRWPSLCHRSPGVPGFKWLLRHSLIISASAFGGGAVFSRAAFARKPWECAETDAGVCVDSRTDALLNVLGVALGYWILRAVVFSFANTRKVPIFLHGTPGSKARKHSGRGLMQSWKKDLSTNMAWVLMLGICICIEVTFLLPSAMGLDWGSLCGWDAFGEMLGLPQQPGVCTGPGQFSSFKCMSCISGVTAGWAFIFLGSLLDIYFVFYMATAVGGSVMGHKRRLNDLKNTSLPVDLRRGCGREARLFERAFGPGWHGIWSVIVETLCRESFIGISEMAGLLEAAGISVDEAPLGEGRERVIHLSRFPRVAAERLAMFFQSLKWIQEDHPSKGMSFQSDTDALTGVDFHPGSIPTLSQIIPVYNETVIPPVGFLSGGSDPQDACNRGSDDKIGLGDLTLPPLGDGVNTNLGFMISQFSDEWLNLAEQLYRASLLDDSDPVRLYRDFVRQELQPIVVEEIQFWAALRMQSVAKTVIGALQYGRALASLPKIREYYARFPDSRVADRHLEVILAHQTYGNTAGSQENDEAVLLLLERYADDPLYLVFDLNKGSSSKLWAMVDDHLKQEGGYEVSGARPFEQAGVKCKWDKSRGGLCVLEVLPRKFPLRLGEGDFKTQGKAGNQLNGLRFASGHYVQTLDCNMGTFIGEAFKVPYVLRLFMPLDQEDRTAVRCRFLGFREHIYTGREGMVGKCYAAAEWTFGTIYQRFLSGMGMRMHYGHPDFMDGFWARNRGGMSKASPVVNLSEDIFAGFNVRMREEASLHVDALEFEKGREASFNAASNSFSKISGGSMALMRSRDTHLLCERIGGLHSLGFYFASVAFYVSNVFVDITIYLYVWMFILFNLAGACNSGISGFGSLFNTAWVISLGFVTLLPQLFELVLEYGAARAARDVVGSFFATVLFFIFQNKNIASSMYEGAVTGMARYLFTGRPLANQHLTWKDIYITYWRSHYQPAFHLLTSCLIYMVLATSNEVIDNSMVLVFMSFVAWVITPIVFSPLPRWNLLCQDLQDFAGFIGGREGTTEDEIPEVVSRGRRGVVRSLYECGLAQEILYWSEQPLFSLFLTLVVRVLLLAALAAIVPAEILDFVPIYLVVLGFSWVVLLGYFTAGLSNTFLLMSCLIFLSPLAFARSILGARSDSPSIQTRMPEYVVALCAFLHLLDVVKHLVLVLCRAVFGLCPCSSENSRGSARLQECVRLCFVYFFVHQKNVFQAYLIMLINTAVASLLTLFEQAFCNMHTSFLLNSELARVSPGHPYMEDRFSSDSELDHPSSVRGSQCFGIKDIVCQSSEEEDSVSDEAGISEGDLEHSKLARSGGEGHLH